MKALIRRVGSALVVAAMIASGMMLGTARVEAKSKGGDGAICSSLLSVITYPYTSPTIKAYAISLYKAYGCDPALLP